MILRLLLPHERCISSLVFATVAHSAASLGSRSSLRSSSASTLLTTSGCVCVRCYWAYAAGLEAVRLDSAYGKGHVRAGRGYLDQGDLFNARLQFRKALDLDSVDKAAAKVRRRVRT